ncbi:MAG: aminotransferase [Methylotenera sp.]|nr:MAG: aminotransferase [Methylotenera sp.]
MKRLFDFNEVINREFSNSLKYDARKSVFGTPNVIPLWVADMDFASPPGVRNALLQRSNHPIYGYSNFPESIYEALIDWFNRRHGWSIERDWIVLSPGVVTSLHAAVLAFTNPEDAVIVQPPVYFPFFSAVNELGRSLINNPLRLKDGQYQIDFEHLETCASNAKMLLLCSPHNPVGRVWRAEELKQLLSIAEKHDLIIVSDEIHADLVYLPVVFQSLQKISNVRKNIITAVAPSKTFNIPGLNLSALIIPEIAQREAVNTIFKKMAINLANPFSMVAFEAAYQEGDIWLDELLEYLQETRNFVIEYIKDNLFPIQASAPEATYLIWLDCRDMGLDDTSLQNFFTYKAGVGLSPGLIFGDAGSGFMRMNIAAPKSIIMDALLRITAALRLHTK